MAATRDQLLQPTQRRFKNVPLPVSGLDVRIRSLFEGEKEAYEAAMMSKSGGVRQERVRDARRRLLVLCIVDDSGDTILSDNDLEPLKRLDGADVAALQDECMVHCGFRAGDIEGLVKNSPAVHGDDSPTD